VKKSLYHIPVFLAGILLVSASCALQKAGRNTIEQVIVYPAPPAPARVQYLVSYSNSGDVEKKKSSFSKFVVGEEGSIPISKPYGVAIHKGKIYVSDLVLNQIAVLDIDKGSFDFLPTVGLGKLQSPLNIFVDEDDKIYIADGERKQIVVFDGDGRYIDAFGGDEKYKPTDVFVDGDSIFVCDLGQHYIQVYKKDNFEWLYRFPEAEPGDEQHLYSPTNISVSGDLIYVSDMGEANIKIFNKKGDYLSSFGTYGKATGQFVRNKGIAVDRDSVVYVVDGAFENVQLFNASNDLLMYFGGSYKGPGDMWLPTTICLDYDNLKYFEKYVDERFILKHLILVCNQYGPDKISVYGAVEEKKK
jgi:DNA-binding beta-propeller fold protein YncE